MSSCASTGGGRRRSRKMRGGMGYGFGGTIGTAGPVWNSSWGGEVTKAGVPVYDTADPQRGSSRRRKSRKARKGGDDPAARTDAQKEAMSGPPQTPSLFEPRPVMPPRRPAGGRRKTRKTRKTRKMRGGMSVAHASAGFAGTGSRGLADYKDVGSSQPFSNDVVPLK